MHFSGAIRCLNRGRFLLINSLRIIESFLKADTNSGMKPVYLVLIPALSFTGLALAQEKPASALWKLSAELGFISTTGNTETQTLNTKAAASTNRNKWRHKFDTSVLRSSDADNITAQQFKLSGQSDYKLEKNRYVFVALNYEDDKFSGYDYRVTEFIGYGRRVSDDKGIILDLEIGPGLRQSKLDNGDSENESLLRVAAKLDWEVSKSSEFTQALTVEASEDATITRSVTSLSSRINGSMSMKMAFTFTNTSEVPANVDETDTETSVTLVFKL